MTANSSSAAGIVLLLGLSVGLLLTFSQGRAQGPAGPSAASAPSTGPASRPLTPAEKIGWRLGMQAYSFNRYTFFEAVDKTAELGMRYIEAFPGQKLSKDAPGTMSHDMNEETQALVKEKLAKAGVKLVNYGVVGLGKEEAGARKVFDWARKMGIETIVSEPAAGDMAMLDKLCQEYSINIAIHNHPKPSTYWDPDILLKAVEGRSKRIGSCADTGHWMRSGLDPMACLKKLEGRIVSLHFKDLNQMGGGHDVPWGTGKADARALLTELHRQGFKGVFSIEYEYNWTSSMPEIAECAKFFNLVAGELAQPKP